jgi:hypothetical protein
LAIAQPYAFPGKRIQDAGGCHGGLRAFRGQVSSARGMVGAQDVFNVGHRVGGLAAGEQWTVCATGWNWQRAMAGNPGTPEEHHPSAIQQRSLSGRK